MQLGSKHVGDGNPCYIIAEIGQNHQGDLYHAVRLIQLAAACGVDAVKLQARDRFEEFTDASLAKPYNGRNSFGRTYGDHREHLDLSEADFAALKQRHRYNENSADLFCTVCATSRIEWLEQNDWCKFYKIASKDLSNRHLIRAVAECGKPVILSTGMATGFADIDAAFEIVSPRAPVVLMHCVSSYPLAAEDASLHKITELKRRYSVPVGYSDHSAGVKVPAVAAIKYEADLIEVHVTKNRAQPGTDHAASLEEPGLRQLIEWIKQAKVMH